MCKSRSKYGQSTDRNKLNYVVSEFDSLYRQEDTYDMSHSSFEFIAAMCYDHVWVAALALNCTDAYLRRNGKF